MAMDVTSQVVHDGARNLVMQFTGLHDGQGGQEDKVCKVDLATLQPVPRRVKVWKLNHDVTGGMVELYWDAPDPVLFARLTYQNEICYESIGGLKTTVDDAASGNILLSTVGFDAGSSYTLKIDMKKY